MKRLLQSDKLLHNFINYIIVLTISLFTNFFIGLTVAITVSLLKEFLWDKKLKKGCFEIMDLISNCLGIIEASIIYWAYYYLILI